MIALFPYSMVRFVCKHVLASLYSLTQHIFFFFITSTVLTCDKNVKLKRVSSLQKWFIDFSLYAAIEYYSQIVAFDIFIPYVTKILDFGCLNLLDFFLLK